MIDALEPRRMLATFDGTAGNDVIRIVSQGFLTTVTRNGVPSSTNDSVITINALGGNDDIYFPRLNRHSGGTFPNIQIFLGDGNDFASNADNVSGTSSLAEFDFPVTVSGGAGNDIVAIDATDDTAARALVLEAAAVGLNSTNGALVHYSSVENIEMYGSPFNDNIQLRGKPLSTALTARGENGNDFFRIANGDLDVTGFTTASTNVFGGNGTDQIIFADRTDGGGENEVYTLSSLTFVKGTTGITYTTMENQTVETGDTGTQTQTVAVNQINGSLATTTILGGNNRQTNVNVTTGNLASLSGTLNVNLGGARGQLTINDQADTSNDAYTITSTQVLKTSSGGTEATINYSNVGILRLNGNTGANDFFVNSTGPSTSTTIADAAGLSFNVYRLGAGNVSANLLGPVFVIGAGTGGSDTMLLDNTLDVNPSFQELDGGAFIDGRTHTASNVSAINILNGAGGGTLAIRRATFPTFVTAPGQTVTVGNGNWEANILANVTVDAGAVTIDDRLDTGNDTYTVDDHVFRKPAAGSEFVSIALGGLPAILQANQGNNTIQANVFNQGTNVHLYGNGGNDHVIVPDASFFSTLQTISVDTGPETPSAVEPFGDYVTVNSDASGADIGARVRLLADDIIRRLSVNNAGVFEVPTGVTAQLGELIIPGGVIDVAGGALLSKPGGPTQATLRTLLTRGFNGGAWNGTNAAGAINSSLAANASSPADAVGYGLGSDIAVTSIGGFNIAAGDVLLRHTLYGDTDLNQVIDGDDYARTDNGFNTGATGWTNGDFDYNDLIDGDDYALIDLGFNSQ
jgi:hypothetical protein